MKSTQWTLIAPFAVSLITATSLPAKALELHTGEPSGAYFNDFCPPIKEAAAAEGVELTCKPSNGTLDNLAKVSETPADFGLAQYDLFAAKLGNDEGAANYTAIRDDIGKECLFLVTKNKLMTNYGDISSSAQYLNFTLPPANSGHAGSFDFLKNIDRDGLGKAAKVTHAASTVDAITTALADENGATLIVQFPNPDSPVFKLVAENGGHFIPVISKEILDQSRAGRKIYTAEETTVVNPKWTKQGEKLVTACTPIILFTGNGENIVDEVDRNQRQNTIGALTRINAEKLRPGEDWFTKIWNGTKAASAITVETLVDASETAKQKSSPYLQKAKEATKDAVEAAKPAYEKAKEKTKEALEAAKPTYEKAKEKTKEAMKAAEPTIEKAKEKTQSFWEQTKQWGRDMVDYFSSDETSETKPETKAEEQQPDPDRY